MRYNDRRHLICSFRKAIGTIIFGLTVLFRVERLRRHSTMGTFPFLNTQTMVFSWWAEFQQKYAVEGRTMARESLLGEECSANAFFKIEIPPMGVKLTKIPRVLPSFLLRMVQTIDKWPLNICGGFCTILRSFCTRICERDKIVARVYLRFPRFSYTFSFV